MKAIAIIPARYASTRFPGKPLVKIGEKTMIQRVYERCKKSEHLSDAVVATDDQRIADEVEDFGGNVIMTSDQHQSGTDRVAEAARVLDLKDQVVVNVQGDEPFVHLSQIEQLVSLFDDESTQIGTLKTRITEHEELVNNNVVKVVSDKKGKAMYFSRHAIPFNRNLIDTEDWLGQTLYFKHLGIYAFRAQTLLKLSKLKPSSLEKTESLEQLRWMENGYNITIAETPFNATSIDTPADLEEVLKKLKTQV